MKRYPAFALIAVVRTAFILIVVDYRR